MIRKQSKNLRAPVSSNLVRLARLRTEVGGGASDSKLPRGNPTEPIQQRARRDPQACTRGDCPEHHFHFFFDTETAREYIDYLTERSDKLPCGRVKEGVAVSQGHGTTTTDHRTDGVSLATPASGLQRNPAFVKPTNPTKTCRHPHRRGSRGQWASSEGVGQTTRDVERTSALTNHSG